MKRIFIIFMCLFMFVGCGATEPTEQEQSLSGKVFEIRRVQISGESIEGEQLANTGHQLNKLVFSDTTVQLTFNGETDTLNYSEQDGDITVDGLIYEYIKISGNILDWKYNDDIIFVFALAD